MHWKGKTLVTLEDYLHHGVLKCNSREESREFMALAHQENPRASENVGYLAGYCDGETASRIYDWFDVEHPVFGRIIPTMQEAFNAGLEMGRRARALDHDPALQEIADEIKLEFGI